MMSSQTPHSNPPILGRFFNSDKIGVIASVLCAFHCAVTPLFFILAPTFGRVWANPATHWGVAIVVVPLAGFAIWNGFRSHRRAWIPICGSVGIGLVLIGAVIPYLENDADTPLSSEAEFVYIVGETGAEQTESACTDLCCPSITTGEDGNLKIHVPAASVVTTLGGIALILAHVGNLRCCSRCRTESQGRTVSL